MKIYSNADHHQAPDFSTDNAFDFQKLGTSDSLSLPSEPPDIRNWFSSYVYESPVLDTNDDFGSCVFKESEFQKEDFGIEEINKEKEEDFGEFRITEGKNEWDHSEKIVLNGFVKSSESERDKKIEHQSIDKGNQWVKLEKGLVVMDKLPSRKISRPNMGGTTTQNQDNSSMEDKERSRLDDEALRKREEVDEEPGLMSLNINKYSSKNDRRSPERFLCQKNFGQKSSEARGQRKKVDIVIAEINLDSVRAIGASLMKSPIKRNDMKNGGNNCSENGFISTRKNKRSRENNENSLQRPQQEKLESLRNVKSVSSAGKKNDAIVKRKALSERINFQSSDASEIAGKWQCPQRSKPNLGPPLKQLRLEQWVRRV